MYALAEIVPLCAGTDRLAHIAVRVGKGGEKDKSSDLRVAFLASSELG